MKIKLEWLTKEEGGREAPVPVTSDYRPTVAEWHAPYQGYLIRGVVILPGHTEALMMEGASLPRGRYKLYEGARCIGHMTVL